LAKLCKKISEIEWILYNNKRLKQVDFDKCIDMYRDHDIFYFKSSLKGGVDVWIEFLNKYIESRYKRAIRIEGDDCSKVCREMQNA
jgi:hypothetical protein